MEAGTAEQQQTGNSDTPEVPADVERSPAEAKTPSELFKYSEWVHIGSGSEECEHATDGRCTITSHFHAFCRLPNQFQHVDIREKALAAKARRVRELNDPDSDASVILDAQLEEMRSMGEEEYRTALIEEAAHKTAARDYFEITEELKHAESEDENAENPWAHIDEDRERLRALSALAPEDRDEDEYNRLSKHVDDYVQEVTRKLTEEKQGPIRESLKDRPIEELVAMVRADRVERDSQARYQQVYGQWEQYLGTLKPRDPEKGLPSERVFGSVQHMKEAAPEVVERLDSVFAELDAEFGKTLTLGSVGKAPPS